MTQIGNYLPITDALGLFRIKIMTISEIVSIICNNCKQRKPLTEFTCHYENNKPVYRICKICINRNNREHYKKDSTKKLANIEKYRKSHPGISRKYGQSLRKRKGQKYRIACNAAIKLKRQGLKPTHCCFCNATGYIALHHPTYDAPELMQPLCRRCHTRVHVLERERKEEEEMAYFNER